MQEQSGPPMPPPAGGDWQRFLRERNAHAVTEVDLPTMNAGDRLVVETRNTRYELLWLEGDEAMLTTNRPDRPTGTIRVQGCAFGRSSTIKPGVLFCGGNLEYVSRDGQIRNRTTTIQGLALMRQEA